MQGQVAKSALIDEVLPGLLRLSLLPFDIGNAFIMGDVLVDSGPALTSGRLIEAIDGLEINAHALTHAHFDHQGASHAICSALNIPLLCNEADKEAVESGDLTRVMQHPDGWLARLGQYLAGPAHPVAHTLSEGDELGGFVVIETPGHTPGHISFWREQDRALVLGDVLFHRNPVTLRRNLQEPFAMVAYSPPMNRESARKVAALAPEVICFGHGAPLRDGEKFARFISEMPND